MKEKPIRVRYDYATEKWFKKHPTHETTVMQCEACGLFYKPSLGHRCKKKDTKVKNDVHATEAQDDQQKRAPASA